MSFIKKIFKKQIKKNKLDISLSIQDNIDKIYPWIKVLLSNNDDTHNTRHEVILEGGDAPIYKKWLDDLAIFYVVDLVNHFQIILKRDLPSGISKEQLHKIAVANLERDIEYKIHTTNFGGYMFIAGGNHEAGSICLPEKWDWLSEYLNDDLIVAIPAKDIILIVPENDPDTITNMKISVYDFLKDGNRILTRNIFKYDRNSKNWTIIDSINPI